MEKKNGQLPGKPKNVVHSFELAGTKYDIVAYINSPGEITLSLPYRKETFMGIIAAFQTERGNWVSYMVTPWQLHENTLATLPKDLNRHPLHNQICRNALQHLEQTIKTA